ncbi:MAG: nucleoside 2-deoxyribosyltransferase [Candidatus Aenigmarchaeota archaeon]|nr:nucleoside 2-deoxyribosyltransferase [Candidatus Aenigmarchaeota archaeon]
MKKVFLASPLFSESEIWFDKQMVSLMEKLGFKVFWSWRDERELRKRKELEGKDWTYKIYVLNRELIDKCDMVVACLDGSDVDSGTAWEIGYAVANKKPVIGIKTDGRLHGKNQVVNLMIQESVSKIVKSLKELEEELRKFR